MRPRHRCGQRNSFSAHLHDVQAGAGSPAAHRRIESCGEKLVRDSQNQSFSPFFPSCPVSSCLLLSVLAFFLCFVRTCICLLVAKWFCLAGWSNIGLPCLDLGRLGCEHQRGAASTVLHRSKPVRPALWHEGVSEFVALFVFLFAP